MKRRRLGQHYLVDGEVVHKIIAFAEIEPTERVLEIGTGRGVLTRELVGKGASLTGYEVDRQNYEATLGVVDGQAQIFLADAFRQKPVFDVLVSSLPYSESMKFIRWLSRMKFQRAIVVLQDDFVEKVMVPPGDRNYRGVSALAQIAFEMRVLMRIGREAFSPRPKVDSVVVSFLPKFRVSIHEDAEVFRLFSLRRRQVGSALAQLKIKGGQDYGRRRVYELRPEEVHRICRRKSR
jgi:16S rRNA (adenine1518-N6/adenine1519-N6)-dimethyltransferase